METLLEFMTKEDQECNLAKLAIVQENSISQSKTNFEMLLKLLEKSEDLVKVNLSWNDF
jgi:hypothetical protein